MSRRRLVWLEDAVDDIGDVVDYVRADNPDAAARLAGRIRMAVAGLADMPGIGRTGRVPATRELVIAGTAYVVVYRDAGDRVEIIAVRHGARRWPLE